MSEKITLSVDDIKIFFNNRINILLYENTIQDLIKKEKSLMPGNYSDCLFKQIYDLKRFYAHLNAKINFQVEYPLHGTVHLFLIGKLEI
jgi:hypothetical protein